MAAGGAGAGGKAGIDNAAIIANLASLPVSFLVLAGICTAMLPTTFGRGCLVALFYWLISLLIFAIIFGVLFAVGFAMFQGGR